MFFTVYVEDTYQGGGRYIHVYTSWRSFVSNFAVSAEYAMRAHVTVLAWDRRSYFGTIYTKAKIYIH
jgi:hypothetical protein